MSSASGTTLNSATGGFTEDAFHRFMKGRDEPAWLAERRREAFARFRAFPHPGAREEEWRRTDIRALKLDAFAPPAAGEPAAGSVAAFDDLWGSMSSYYTTGMLHVNGISAREPDPAKLGGAVFIDLARAAKDHPEILDRYLLTQAVTAGDDFFAALHAAFWTGGSLLYVPKGVKLDTPLFSLVGLTRDGGVDFNHTLVVLEDGAEATLVRETAGRRGAEPGPAMHAGALEVFLAQGRGSGWSTSRTGTMPPGTSAGSAPSSAATPPSSGPSAAWARGWPRSTRKSSWPGRAPMRRSTASCSPPDGSTWRTSRGRTTPPTTRPATCSTGVASRTGRGWCGRG